MLPQARALVSPEKGGKGRVVQRLSELPRVGPARAERCCRRRCCAAGDAAAGRQADKQADRSDQKRGRLEREGWRGGGRAGRVQRLSELPRWGQRQKGMFPSARKRAQRGGWGWKAPRTTCCDDASAAFALAPSLREPAVGRDPGAPSRRGLQHLCSMRPSRARRGSRGRADGHIRGCSLSAAVGVRARHKQRLQPLDLLLRLREERAAVGLQLHARALNAGGVRWLPKPRIHRNHVHAVSPALSLCPYYINTHFFHISMC